MGSRREEAALLHSVERYLQKGRDLYTWWQETYPDGFADRFELNRSSARPDHGFGFFDTTSVAGRRLPVMGNYQHMFYDRPKPFAGASQKQEQRDWTQQQLRRFALRYFMRVSDYRRPAGCSSDLVDPPPWLRSLGKDHGSLDSTVGFNFSQLYYKTSDGEIGAFSPAERSRIVDLRRLKDRYEWIVAKVRIFDFSFSVRPLGHVGPRLTMPLEAESYLVISADFISDSPVESHTPEVDTSARFGLGYAFIGNPRRGVLGYGPGEFEAAVQMIDFFVDPDGQARVEMGFVANRPRKIVNLPLDPADWGHRLAKLANGGRFPKWLSSGGSLSRLSPLRGLSFDPIYGGIRSANLLTGGWARRRLGVSRRALEKKFLIKHLEQHYETLAASLHTWRQIPDWLDTEALPDWVRQGGPDPWT